MIGRVKQIWNQLGEVRFSDIVPRDEEAERHAQEHLELERKDADDDDDEIVEMSEERRAKREIEGLEDMMMKLNGNSVPGKSRPTMDDVRRVKMELFALCGELGMLLQ